MSTQYDVYETLDVQGLNCPMPVVKAKQAVDEVPVDGVLEVVATDPGSMSDLAGWAEGTAGVEMLDQVDEGEVFRHYVRRTE